jgi:hypothetical protein
LAAASISATGIPLPAEIASAVCRTVSPSGTGRQDLLGACVALQAILSRLYLGVRALDTRPELEDRGAADDAAILELVGDVGDGVALLNDDRRGGLRRLLPEGGAEDPINPVQHRAEQEHHKQRPTGGGLLA